MKIGILQPCIKWEDKEANIEKLKGQLHAYDEGKIELLLLPEMSFTGFSMDTRLTGEENRETIQVMRELCKQYSLAIGCGWVKGKSNSENHYTVIDKSGQVISDYVKIHPFSFSGEDKHFLSGNRLSFFEISGIRFSSVICYDLRFPELFRLASKRANVIIVPANWPQKRNEHWETLLKARAIENQVYIIAVNCVGNIGGLDYCGNSCVIAPDGSELIKAKGVETLMEFNLIDDVQKYRDEFPTYRDRKDDLYNKMQMEV